MRKGLGGTGTPFGYTDPDLYELELDEAFSAILASGQVPLEGAAVLLALWMNGEDVQVDIDGREENGA